jgi:hypothetical protein
MWDAAYGAVDNTVRTWVRDLVSGLYGFLHMIFGDVGTAWDNLQTAALNLWHGLERFSRYVSEAFSVLFRVVIPHVIRDYLTRIATVLKYARDIFDYVVREIARVVHLISASIQSLWQLVLRDVYRPLLASLTSAWHWITHEGAIVWFYVSHPDKLTDLLWQHLIAKLEREAWNVSALLGKFFLSLVIRNLKRLALLIEDILDAVL